MKTIVVYNSEHKFQIYYKIQNNLRSIKDKFSLQGFRKPKNRGLAGYPNLQLQKMSLWAHKNIYKKLTWYTQQTKNVLTYDEIKFMTKQLKLLLFVVLCYDT